jgi:PEP-CTERM motif
VSFTIDSAAGIVVPEPGQALLTLVGVGTVAILLRKRG